MKERYEIYKKQYNNYIILFKQGSFYLGINDDALVLNNLFNYKIKCESNFIKIGFPLKTIDKIISILKEKTINYIVIDKDITNKEKFSNNNYNKYINNDLTNYEFILNRINKVDEILKDNLLNPNIEYLLSDIEKIICRINYR